MPRRSSLKSLPPQVLDQINKMLVDGEWTIDQVVEYLADAGHPRSRSAVGRYRVDVERQAARLRQSREMTEALGRELGDAALQGKQGRLLVEMSRNLVHDFLDRAADNPDGLDAKDIAALGKGLAELGRALRFDQDFETRLRDQIAAEEQAKARKAAADTAGEALAHAGLTAGQVKFWREDFLGVRRRAEAAPSDG